MMTALTMCTWVLPMPSKNALKENVIAMLAMPSEAPVHVRARRVADLGHLDEEPEDEREAGVARRP